MTPVGRCVKQLPIPAKNCTKKINHNQTTRHRNIAYHLVLNYLRGFIGRTITEIFVALSLNWRLSKNNCGLSW